LNPIRARLRDAAHAALVSGGYGSGVGHYCEKISPGCAMCYASGSQPRFGMPEFPGARKSLVTLPVLIERGAVPVSDRVELFFDDSKLWEVIRRRTPTKWFWCDQTDLFGSWVPDAWIDRCFATMAVTLWHTHQILTKRVDRMAAYLLTPGRLERIGRALTQEMADLARQRDPGRLGLGKVDPRCAPGGWPFLNVHVGFSAENQDWWDQRLPHARGISADGWLMWCSAEPLIGPLNASGARGVLSWLVCGGESGPGARRFDLAWGRDIARRCEAAGVPVFMKQIGSNAGWTDADGDWHPVRTADRKGGTPEQWPDGFPRVREFPRAEVAHA
jgi:protein gp37